MLMGRGQAGLAVQEEQANVLASRMEAYRKQSGQLGEKERKIKGRKRREKKRKEEKKRI
jgi:hypothetical protein